MRTNIINRSTTRVFGTRQDRIVTAGNDRCAQVHARLLSAWHMHVAMAWQAVDATKRRAKQAYAAAAAALGFSSLALWSLSVEPAVVVSPAPQASVRRG